MIYQEKGFLKFLSKNSLRKISYFRHGLDLSRTVYLSQQCEMILDAET